MITINEDQLLSAVRQVFTKMNSKYCSVFEMEWKLIEEGLTPKKTRQPISLARTKQEIGMCYRHVDGVDRELCYQLLTEEEIEWEEEEELQDLEEDTRIRMKKTRTHKRAKKGEKGAS